MASSVAGLLQNPDAPPRRLAAHLAAWLGQERAQWPLFVPVAIGVGVALWFGLPSIGLRRAALLLSLGVAASGIAARGPLRPLLAGAGLLVALGLVAADARNLSVAAPRLHHRVGPVTLEGLVLEVEPRETGARILLLREGSPGASPDRFAIRLRDAPPAGLEPGARVRVPAMLSPSTGPSAPGGFQAARRAWFEKVAASGLAIGPPTIVERAPDDAHRLLRLRGAINRHLSSTLGPERGALAAALVTGAQGAIPRDILDAVRASGLAHLLTVSGFHIGIVAGFIFVLARRLLLFWPALSLRVPTRALAAIAAALGAWTYVLLSGAEVPAVRSGLTASIVLLAVALGRDPFSLRLIALAAATILVARPEALLSPSFQLSFAAVTAIILLLNAGPVAARFRRQPGDGLPTRLGKALCLLLLTSLVAELVLTPIAVAHFGRAGTWGVAANLLAIPLVTALLMPLLGFHLAAGLVGLDGLTALPLSVALDGFARIASLFSALPGASLLVPAVPPAAFALGVAGALLLALLRSPLRLLGAPLLAGALILHLSAERPDLFVAADARQVGLVGSDGTLFIARGTGDSQVVRAFQGAAAAGRVAPLADAPGAVCSEGGCAIPLRSGTVRLLVLRGDAPPDAQALARACAAADLVIAPEAAPCAPRWRLLDRAALAPTGAVAVNTRTRRIVPAAGPPSDHPWHPAALPGVVQSLLLGRRWMEPIAE